MSQGTRMSTAGALLCSPLRNWTDAAQGLIREDALGEMDKEHNKKKQNPPDGSV